MKYMRWFCFVATWNCVFFYFVFVYWIKRNTRVTEKNIIELNLYWKCSGFSLDILRDLGPSICNHDFAINNNKNTWTLTVLHAPVYVWAWICIVNILKREKHTFPAHQSSSAQQWNDLCINGRRNNNKARKKTVEPTTTTTTHISTFIFMHYCLVYFLWQCLESIVNKRVFTSLQKMCGSHQQ